MAANDEVCVGEHTVRYDDSRMVYEIKYLGKDVVMTILAEHADYGADVIKRLGEALKQMDDARRAKQDELQGESK